jgi:hypothetical protein
MRREAEQKMALEAAGEGIYDCVVLEQVTEATMDMW